MKKKFVSFLDYILLETTLSQEEFETIMSPILSDGIPISVIFRNMKRDTVYGLLK